MIKILKNIRSIFLLASLFFIPGHLKSMVRHTYSPDNSLVPLARSIAGIGVALPCSIAAFRLLGEGNFKKASIYGLAALGGVSLLKSRDFLGWSTLWNKGQNLYYLNLGVRTGLGIFAYFPASMIALSLSKYTQHHPKLSIAIATISALLTNSLIWPHYLQNGIKYDNTIKKTSKSSKKLLSELKEIEKVEEEIKKRCF